MSQGGIANATDTEPRRTMAAPSGLLSRLWPLYVTIWLVFLITGPVATMLAPPLTPVRVAVALVWTAAFFAAYLWLMLYKPFRGDLTASERRLQIGLLALLTGLVLIVDVAYPTGWFWLFIYVVMPVGVVLPTGPAIGTIIAITLLACGVEAARGEWATVTAVPGVALWGFATVILRRLVVTVEELRAAREELARLAVAEERLRFARDLHDLLGHSLSLITLKSELAGRLMPTDRARAAAEVADIERVARQALREVREAVAGYRRPTLATELDGVRALLIAAGVEPRIEAAAGPVPPAVDETIAWAVREGATNVIRHSGARQCEIRITRDDEAVRAEVIDDGRGGLAGIGPDERGSGLRGLAERVAALDGEMVAGPGQDGGFRLAIALPRDGGERTGVTGGTGAERQ